MKPCSVRYTVIHHRLNPMNATIPIGARTKPNHHQSAVSAATTYLVHAGVTRKEREPGGRRTVHALLADDWYGIMLNRDKILGTTKALMHEGLQAVGGRGSHAGQRLWLSEELFAFLETEMAKVYLRWEDRKRELLG